jgi:hypothetical protein
VRPFLEYRSCLIEKTSIPLSISVTGQEKPLLFNQGISHSFRINCVIIFSRADSSCVVEHDRVPSLDALAVTPFAKSLLNPTHTTRVSLFSICHGRSGDKGDVANIGIICRNPIFYDLILQKLTPQVCISESYRMRIFLFLLLLFLLCFYFSFFIL